MDGREWSVPPRLRLTFDPGLPDLAATLALRRRSDGTGDFLGPSSTRLAPLLAMGVPPHQLFQALMGRPFPVASKRAGSVATSSVLTSGVLEPVPLPGGMLQVMAGVTVAAHMQGTERVGLILSSPGSSSTGAWHEGLNLAAVRRAPLVVVCHAPVGVGRSRETRLETLLDLCPGYGIRGWEAAMDDLEGILQTSAEAVAAARAGGGVQLLELRGESLSTDERVAALLEGVRRRLLEHAEVEKGELEGWEASIPDEVEDAWNRAVAEQSGVASGADETYQVEGVSRFPGRLNLLPDRPSSQVPFSLSPEVR